MALPASYATFTSLPPHLRFCEAWPCETWGNEGRHRGLHARRAAPPWWWDDAPVGPDAGRIGGSAASAAPRLAVAAGDSWSGPAEAAGPPLRGASRS
eukprot:CAMPEP_0179136360 /NCGR_PEP_ID=MMETSP0796-20121207/64976_1 /TAXON_ID=73915 /ORGANISM="Pyrodinium bahamense, Strain pbaha01" /LENGTH=96 /DNA_ID=CAMNT_0020835441 /DNA_START=94 /DNA_END=381 /DNA_ORIENTATION=-